MKSLPALILSIALILPFAGPQRAAAGFHNSQRADLRLGNQDTPVNSHRIPTHVAHLWVVDWANHRVLRFDNPHTMPFGAAANGVLGQVNFTTSPRGTSITEMHPGGFGLGTSALTVDGSGRLWVADAGNNRVLWFNKPAQKANGAAADGVLGQPAFASPPALRLTLISA